MSHEPQDGTPDDGQDVAPVEQNAETGTPDDAGSEDNKGKLIATLQENVAKERREREERERRIAELESRLAGTTPPTPEAGSNNRAAAYAEALRAAAADPGHPNHDYAVFEMEKWRRQQSEIAEVKINLQFDALPETERDGARKFFQTGDYRTPEAARRAWLGSLSDDERAKLKPRTFSPRREEREEIVDTATRPLSPAGVSQRTLKMGEWHREYDKASAAGDTKRIDELRRNFPR